MASQYLLAKKKSKFKSFKKFFGKKKRKETLPSLGKSYLKQSQSASDVTVPDSMRVDYDSEEDIGSAAGVLGSRAVSHDSIFIPEMVQETARPVRVFSQENVSDRIKALQLKLQSNTRSGPTPFGFLNKRTDDAGTSSEDDGLPRSPPEMSLIHEALKSRFTDSYKNLSSLSLAGTGSEEDEQISSGHSSRPLSPEEKQYPNLTNSRVTSPQRKDSSSVSPSADFDNPPQFSSCLDNSAARHRLSVRPRNQRSSKIRRPSEALQEESHGRLYSTEEEDDMQNQSMTASTKEHRDEKAAEILTAGLGDSYDAPLPDLLSPNVQENEMCFQIIMGKNTQTILEEEHSKQTILEQFSALSSTSKETTNAAETKLEWETKVQNELLEESNKSKIGNASNCLGGMENCASLNEGTVITNKQDNCPPASLSSNENNILKEKGLSVGSTKEGVKSSAAPDLSTPILKSSHLGLSHEPLQSNKSYSPVSQVAINTELSLTRSEKSRSIAEKPLSDKDNNKLVGNVEKKVEKSVGENGALRKFSVSSAWERTGSFSLKGNAEAETLKNIKQSLPKSGMSISEKVKDDPRPDATHTETRASSRKKETLADSESKSADKAVLSCNTTTQSTVPTVSDLSAVADTQTGPEDKNPFFVKLRTTSLSLRYRDGTNPESSRVKRHSAEIKQEKTECLPFSKDELAEVKSTAINSVSSKSENLKCKTNLIELTAAKPPLPKKPFLQNITTTDNNTNKDDSEAVTNQEKKAKSTEPKIQKRASERRPSFHKTIADKSSPSPVTTAEPAKGTESKPQPVWVSLVRQKQRSLKEEVPPTEEKPGNQEPEKQSKERTEVRLRQQVDKTTTSVASIVPETHRQEAKAELKEQRQRANTFSHPVHATQSSPTLDNEEKTPPKQANYPLSNQPSWMELAKKKSQAWSDMPQIIK
ncbi:CRACD-like protein [Discoglossus pictus]